MASTEIADVRTHTGSAVKSHRLGTCVLAVLGALIGAGVTFALPTGYVASTSVLVFPIEGNPYNPTTQGSDLQKLETEAQLVKADVVVHEVRTELGTDLSEDELSAGVGVSISPNTQVLGITFHSQDPDLAEAVVRQFASSYLDRRAERSDTSLRTKTDDLSQRIVRVTDQLRKLKKSGAGDQNAEVRALGGQLTNLRLQAAAVSASDATAGEMITAPEAVRSGVQLAWWVGAVGGLLFGMLAGLGWAMFKERRADLVRTIDDVEQFGLVVLSSASADPRVGDGSEVNDAARSTGNMVWRKAEQPASVAVAMIGREAGEPRFGEALAIVLLEGGDQTLLVDGLGDPDLDRDGLSEVLGRVKPLSAAVETGSSRVPRIGVGRDPDAADSFLPTSRMTQFLDEASQTYAWVVVQSPTVDGSAGRAMVSACTHWVALIDPGMTTRHELSRAITWSEAAGVSILGVVLTDGTARGHSPSAPDVVTDDG